MDKANQKNKQKEPAKAVQQPQEDTIKYIYDKKSKKWKMVNPSGSIAYNCLTRDEWNWLD